VEPCHASHIAFDSCGKHVDGSIVGATTNGLAAITVKRLDSLDPVTQVRGAFELGTLRGGLHAAPKRVGEDTGLAVEEPLAALTSSVYASGSISPVHGAVQIPIS